MHSLSHQYDLKMLFYEDVSIVKKLKMKVVTTTITTTLTVPWSELRHRQKELQLQFYGLGIAADKNNCWIPPRTEFNPI